MGNKIPGIINQCIAYRNGDQEIVGTASATLPDLNQAEEEIKVMGAGAIKMAIEGHYDALALKLKFSNICDSITLGGKSEVDLTLMVALQESDKENGSLSDIKQMIIEVKGQRQGISGGDIAPATRLETEVTINLTYYKIEIAGKVIYEIDVLNNKCVIDGVDIMADINKAVGR